MAPNDPPPPSAADGDDDALRRLEERLDRASDAAERLISEAAAQSRPPPSGWRAPDDDDEPARAPDLGALFGLLDSLRELVPTDLQQRLIDALKELLLAVRAMLDWYLERLDSHRPQPTEVQDIPISWE